MGDAFATTVASTYPLVVFSTTQKETTLDNSPNPPEAHNSAREVPKYKIQSHGNLQNLHSEGPRTMPTDLSHPHGLPEMPHSPYLETSTHSPLRYPSVAPGFQSPNIQGIVQSTNTIYYPFQDNRYSQVYYAPQYAPQTLPASQMPIQHGAYFYTPGYPHSYTQTPTVITGVPPNPNSSLYQPQIHSSPPRWPPGQQHISHYSYMTNPFVAQPTPPPMQQSFSHPVQGVQQLPQQPPLPLNYRRHSHPVRNTFTRVKSNDSDLSQSSNWGGQGPRTGIQTGQGSSRSVNINSTLNTCPSTPPPTQKKPGSCSPHMDGGPSVQPVETPNFSILTTVISGAHPALPRGPPRKPRQSGHALWVGNLPPGTNVIELKDHFSDGATRQIESVFLISKSNCAFINYKTDTACNDAMIRFHDNKFKGVRLVCRLRRHSSASPVTVTPKEKSQNSSDSMETQLQGDDREKTGSITNDVDGEGSKGKYPGVDGEETKVREQSKDRIFILKSLTVEDLDLSVRNGVWATQTHNEDALNRAFETCENVYLIFSANKSGEYYGYAKMTSRIPEKEVDESEAPKSSDTSVGVHRIGATSGLPEALLPRAIYTPPTGTAPEGRIIDDSARGTIFWEATEEESTEGGPHENNDKPDLDSDELVSATKSWGKPFNVQWLSTTKLPFYKTRGLKNSWNLNREVKIARDGTEVEETVGKRLLQMFNQRAAGNPPPQS